MYIQYKHTCCCYRVDVNGIPGECPAVLYDSLAYSVHRRRGCSLPHVHHIVDHNTALTGYDVIMIKTYVIDVYVYVAGLICMLNICYILLLDVN